MTVHCHTSDTNPAHVAHDHTCDT